MERVRPGKRGAHPAITEFNQEDFEMFFRLVRRPETSVWPQPPSQRSPQFPVASCLVKIHSSHRKTGFLRAHGPSESATSECKRGCGRTIYFKICGILQRTVPSQFSVALALKSSITRKLWQASKLNCKLSVERFFCSFVHVHSLILV